MAIEKVEGEGPIPTQWRATVSELVASMVNGDYKSGKVPTAVVPIDQDTVRQVSDYIQDYGCTLINLPEEAWDTSVCIWQASYWELLVDLYTREEGRSDMVLSLKVNDDSATFSFQVYMVYVP